MSLDTQEVPSGFGPIFRSSPLLDTLGDFYSRGAGAALELGMRVSERHTNARGDLHGGVIATLADIGMGYLLAFQTDPQRRFVTVSLTVDYVAPATKDDWVEVRLDAVQLTGRLAFTTARLVSGDHVIACARGIFSAA